MSTPLEDIQARCKQLAQEYRDDPVRQVAQRLWERRQAELAKRGEPRVAGPSVKEIR